MEVVTRESFILDLGFDSAKWKLDDETGKMPSTYRRTTNGGFKFDGYSYIVGEEAIGGAGAEWLRSENDLVKYYPLFAAACAEQAGIVSATTLVISLPYQRYRVERQKRNDNKSNLIDKLIGRLSSFTVSKRTYRFNSVFVQPQGIGALYSYLGINAHQQKESILCIDIGFNTVIYALYNAQRKATVYHRTLYGEGISTLCLAYVQDIVENYAPGYSLTNAQLSSILQAGELQWRGSTIDLREQLQDAIAQYVYSLNEKIDHDLARNAMTYTYQSVLFAGGGSQFLRQFNLNDSNVNVVISAFAEYANVFGFDIMGKLGMWK